MIVPKELVADLQQQMRQLERDLLARAESDPAADAVLRKRYDTAVNRSRTGLTFEAWRDQQLTQVAAGWILACVYTRFCEDNHLLDHPLLAGVRGSGLWLAAPLTEAKAPAVRAAAQSRGFLVNPVQPDAVRLAPPLILSPAEADEFLAAFPAILEEAAHA